MYKHVGGGRVGSTRCSLHSHSSTLTFRYCRYCPRLHLLDQGKKALQVPHGFFSAILHQGDKKAIFMKVRNIKTFFSDDNTLTGGWCDQGAELRAQSETLGGWREGGLALLVLSSRGCGGQTHPRQNPQRPGKPTHPPSWERGWADSPRPLY